MGKIKSIIKGFGLSALFVLLGIYILNTTNSILETIIGIANIAFFGILILWAIFKIYKNSHANAK
jgi:hypothetical protein